MTRHFYLSLSFGLTMALFIACGETVNYATREKTVVPPNLQDMSPGSGNVETGGLGSSKEIATGNTAPESLAVRCNSPELMHQREELNFPEIPQGTTCAFGMNDNLSRKDGWIRAYLRQNQDITLPAGATLCGFSMEPTNKAMHYDDEMFFLIENRILVATKDYTDYFQSDGLFHTFSWDALVNKVYNQFDQRGLYCAGQEQGLSQCQLPPTDTTGSIDLRFSAELSNSLAQLLQKQEVLHFSWVTTGDNDDSDCRHTALSLPMVIHYLPAVAKP